MTTLRRHTTTSELITDLSSGLHHCSSDNGMMLVNLMRQTERGSFSIIYGVGVFFAVVAVATVSAADDWLNPNLPSTLKPVNYVVWMHPEFYGSSAVFHGRVDIDVKVEQDTRTIIVHYKTLNITSTTLTDQFNTIVPVSQL